jgi:TolA-binding protein
MKFNTLKYAVFFVLSALVFSTASVYAQLWQQGMNEGNASGFTMINRGIELYGDGQWGNAIIQLRRAQQENIGATSRAEAQFWIAMATFAAGDYERAIHDFDEISRIDPLNIRCTEVAYHKGRAYYYLRRYEEAIKLFSNYVDSIRIDGRYLNGIRTSGWNENGLYSDPDGDYNRKSSAIYWMGECFYSMNNITSAEELFNIVVKEYPKSHKFEPSTNRLALIKQKKIEAALLDILKNSSSSGAPASPVTEQDEAEAVQQRTTEEEEIIEYQRRIAPYLINEAYKEQNLVPAVPPVAQPVPAAIPVDQLVLAAPPVVQPAPVAPPVVQPAPAQDGRRDTIMRLLAIKTTALEIMDRLMSVLNANEIIEDTRW